MIISNQDIESIKLNRAKLSDSIKILVLKSLKKTEYFDSEDELFLNPPLFAHFNYGKPIEIEETLGYINNSDNFIQIEDFSILKNRINTTDKYFQEIYRGKLLNDNPIFNSNYQPYVSNLEGAILIIKENLPDLYHLLVLSNRMFFLHDNTSIINFVTFQTQGLLYFHTSTSATKAYFIEELLHQGAHNLLNILLMDKKLFFTVEPTIRMGKLNDNNDYRTLYSAVHGLFTVAMRLFSYDILLQKNALCNETKHEIVGRLIDQFSRLNTGIELLDMEKVFTQRGSEFVSRLLILSNNIIKKYNYK